MLHGRGLGGSAPPDQSDGAANAGHTWAKAGEGRHWVGSERDGDYRKRLRKGMWPWNTSSRLGLSDNEGEQV